MTNQQEKREKTTEPTLQAPAEDPRAELANTLLKAIRNNCQQKRVFELIDKGADVNHTFDNGKTLLFYAISYQSYVAFFLIDAGADVNATDDAGKTALMYCAEYACDKKWIGAGQTSYYHQVVFTLIQKNANVNISDKEGKTALMYATLYNRPDLLTELLKAGADVNQTDNEGRTALMYTAQKEKQQMLYHLASRDEPVDNKVVLTMLIEAGADVNMTDVQGMTALMFAAQSNKPSLVDELVKAGADVQQTDNEGRTGLMYAAQGNKNRQYYDENDQDKMVVKMLIDAGTDVMVTDNRGKTALDYSVEYDKKHLACTLIDAGADVNVIDRHAKTELLSYSSRVGNESVVQVIIKAGIDINVKDEQGKTALMYAIQHKKESIACTLLDAGADYSVIDNDGQSALFFAAFSGDESMAQRLIKAGADISIIDKRGRTALMYAIQEYKENIACTLLDAGADHSVIDNNGQSALLFAAMSGNENFVQKLLKAGADLNITDNQGKTALTCAVLYGRNKISVAAELIKAGVDVNTTDNNGKTALMYCAQNNEKALTGERYDCDHQESDWYKITIILIEAGADVNISDNKEKTALMYAAENNWEHLVCVLIDAGGNVNIIDKRGKSALSYSVQNEKFTLTVVDSDKAKVASENIACKLIKAGADVNITDYEGKTPLMYAVQCNLKMLTNELIKARADVSITDNNGKTALMHSLKSQHYEESLALIKAGADVNISDHEGKTALFYGLAHEDITRALIEEGHAIVNKRDRYGRSVLFYSITGSLTVTNYLLDKGGDLNMKDNCSMNVTSFFIEHLMCEQQINSFDSFLYELNTLHKTRIHPQTVFEAIVNSVFCKIFHCMAPYPDTKLRILNQALVLANQCITEQSVQEKKIIEEVLVGIKGGNLLRVIELLVKLDADSNFTDEGESTALHYATFLMSKDVKSLIQALVLAKQYITEQSVQEEKTIEEVLIGIQEGNLSNVVELLLGLGANPNYADMHGNTALHYATCLSLIGTCEDTVAMTMCQKLEGLGVSLNVKNHENETPLLFCLSKKEWINTSLKSSKVKTLVEVCRFFLKHGSSVEETTRNGEAVFHLTLKLFQEGLLLNAEEKLAEEVLTETVKLLQLFPSSRLSTAMSVNKRDANLNTPLHLWAMLELHLSSGNDSSDVDCNTFKVNLLGTIFKQLVACGAKLNDRNKNEVTPLHLCRSWTAVKLLINAGANPKVLDSEGHSPLLLASKRISNRGNNHLYQDVSQEPKAFWKTALDHNLDPGAADNHGTSVLSILIQQEAFDLSKALVKVTCEENYIQSDTIAVSLLNAVCQNSSTRKQWKNILVKMILKSRKVKPTSHKSNEDTPLHLCCRNIIKSSEESFSYSRFNTSERSEQTSVHWTIIKQLLSYGMDCNALDASGQSCLDIAKKCPSLKSLLLKPPDIDEVPLAFPWTSISTMYKPILSKVARQQECKHIDSYWYHENYMQKGSFGLVFAGMNEKDGREVAIKRMEKLRNQQSEADKKEITTLTALADCEQVVRYLSFTEDENFCYVILELMEGNLDDYLDGDAFDVARSVQLCGDVLSGLTYLHQQNILHRDLKPSNILFKTYPKLCLKIADFGLSRHIDTLGTYTTSSGSVVGTRCWIAPEVLKCSSKKTKHQKACDVFSAGLVIHYILSGKKHPFTPADCTNKSELQISNETEANVINGKMEGLGDALSPEATNLVQIMLDSDPPKRPTAAMTLKHPFFWSETKKMDFLSSVGNQPDFEYSRAKKHKEALPFTSVEYELDGKLKSIILAHPTWDDANYVHMPAIYTEMTKKRKPYNTSSVVELVRFIRNTLAHISEDKRPTLVRKLVLEDFVFLEYFPNLVMEVFKCIMMHGWDSREEIKNRLS